MQPKVSVIIPVYNSEKYLKQCIDSIVNQSLTDIEIIFVDDGSTDRSADIIESYKKCDKRIQLLRQKNLHAGTARNEGMRIAKGKYLSFLDSDDYFEPNMLEESYYIGEENEAQIVLFEYSFFDNLTGITSYEFDNKCLGPGIVNPSQSSIFLNIYGNESWNKLFLRSYIVDNNLWFQNLVNSNDAFFVNMALYLANRVYYLNKVFVHYRINNRMSLQGSAQKDLTCPFQYLIAIRKELNYRKIINQNINDHLNFKLDGEIDWIFNSTNSIESIKKGFEYAKMHIVPEFYPSVESIPNDSKAKRLLNSNSVESYLWDEVRILRNKVQNMEEKYIPKECTDYCLGYALLKTPRRIKKILMEFSANQNKKT